MRHPNIPIHQEWRQRVIRRLLRETVERTDIIEDIHQTLKSLLSHADEILSDTRRDFIEMSTAPLERDRSRRRVETFHASATEILGSLRQSLQALGGEDTRLLMRQADKTENIIGQVHDLCMLLINEASELLTG
jgi:hypothetical protein